MNGIYLVDKRVDWTSRDCVNRLSHILHTKKIGHTGTLDPFATGLLIITVGPSTKILPFMEGFSKTYVASLKLGATTATLDLETPETVFKEIPPLTKEDIEQVFKDYIGKIKQIPPTTSAIKIDGVPAYKRYRAGETITMKTREVEVYDLKFISYVPPVINFMVTCSSGTYVRTLGADIAQSLNTLGYLTALRRTKIGPFLVSAAKDVENITLTDAHSSMEALIDMPRLNVNSEQKELVIHGRYLQIEQQAPLLLMVDDNLPLAIYYWNDEEKIYKCRRGLL